ncbi:SHOCT domain-containing protein [Paenibacillus sp. RC334]|uniref:SHOCT domain-containing protein n=1 Tax=Paenibacillus sp. RC334 TaxID=3045840 RepID=UPI0024B8A0AD|nr:SHOCT domain-containing protein [Paenibacillus sp. RC334]
MQRKSIDYLLSLSLLKQLRSQHVITEEEFIAIDQLNKKIFQVAITWAEMDLMMCRKHYTM